jgi:hypothetical protein
MIGCNPRIAIFSLIAFLVFAAPASPQTQAGGRGQFDGPAELPRVHMDSSLAATPASGKVISVKSGENLQQALEHVNCGDTLQLEAGATFTGNFYFRQKPCDDQHWIIVRTSAPDAALPPQGTRLTPCYAGVASLPGRPDFHCSSPKNVLAKISFEGRGGSGPLFFTEGANHYRLIGLEITRAAPGASVRALISAPARSAVDHIVLDRVWVHGGAQEETTRGIYLSGMKFVAIVDSFFSDFHCTAREGACTDSQAIAGGDGDLPMGVYLIVNNFLEAAGENIIFGGSAAATTPADIEIRNNYLFKPRTWMQGEPGFVGGPKRNPFIIKNLFELKNAQRVLFENNVLENSWGGFSQTGYGILITPRNQSTGKANICPICQVTDVTIRYCKISHVGSGIQIANSRSVTGGAATAGQRYSVHDLVFDDIDGKAYHGFGLFAAIYSEAPLLRDVKLDHITAFAPRGLFDLSHKTDEEKIPNLSVTNSILNAGDRELSSAGGGPANCAYHGPRMGPTEILNNCFSPVVFAKNAIIGTTGDWPRNNFYPKDADAVGFVNFNHGNGGDYRLCFGKGEPEASCKRASPYIRAGTDDKNLGADMDAINAVVKSATSGVLATGAKH